MTRNLAIQLLLAVSLAVVIAGAVWSARRTHHAADYLIANRRLGAWLAAFGYVGSATSAWTLMLVVGAAFTWGLAAIWFAGAFALGALLSVGYIAPRLRASAAAHDATTLTQLISADAGDRLQPVIVRSAAFIALLSLLFQAALFARLAAELLHVDSGRSIWTSVTIGVGVVTACVLAGGLRAASVCDAIQTIALAVTAMLLPIPAFFALGSWDVLVAGMNSLGPAVSDWYAGKSGVVALAFAAGALGLGCAIPGQPHAMARFMAVREERSLLGMRWLAMAVTVLLLGAALLSGWCARVLYDGLQQPELALYALATRMLPPALAAVFVVALFVALMLSIASPMLAIASQYSVDLRRTTALLSAGWTRFALVLTAAATIVLALLMPMRVADHALFPFIALGASFGPLLLVRLTGKRIRPGSVLAAMWAGFALAIIFHLLPDSPGDFLERVLPFVAALGIALTGGERRRNPDRADRAQETVHDRIPI